MSYLFLIVVTMIMGFGAQWYINHSYKKYSSVDSGTGMTGAQIARRMLDDNGLQCRCTASAAPCRTTTTRSTRR